MAIAVGGTRVQPVAPLGSAESVFPAAAPVGEAAWCEWAMKLPPLVLEGRRVVVVAPHPDDEALGCGGLLHDLAGRGVEVQVVTVTNGEGSHRHWDDLAATRCQEQREALDVLGVSTVATLLGVPDGAVEDHVDRVEDALVGLVAGADLVVAPWEYDGHADHDAVGRVVTRVGARTGVGVLAHPVWAWQWAAVSDLTGPTWQRWDLSPSTMLVKTNAMARHRSQISNRHGPAVLGGEVLARAARTYEVYTRVG